MTVCVCTDISHNTTVPKLGWISSRRMSLTGPPARNKMFIMCTWINFNNRSLKHSVAINIFHDMRVYRHLTQHYCAKTRWISSRRMSLTGPPARNKMFIMCTWINFNNRSLKHSVAINIFHDMRVYRHLTQHYCAKTRWISSRRMSLTGPPARNKMFIMCTWINFNNRSLKHSVAINIFHDMRVYRHLTQHYCAKTRWISSRRMSLTGPPARNKMFIMCTWINFNNRSLKHSVAINIFHDTRVYRHLTQHYCAKTRWISSRRMSLTGPPARNKMFIMCTWINFNNRSLKHSVAINIFHDMRVYRHLTQHYCAKTRWISSRRMSLTGPPARNKMFIMCTWINFNNRSLKHSVAINIFHDTRVYRHLTQHYCAKTRWISSRRMSLTGPPARNKMFIMCTWINFNSRSLKHFSIRDFSLRPNPVDIYQAGCLLFAGLRKIENTIWRSPKRRIFRTPLYDHLHDLPNLLTHSFDKSETWFKVFQTQQMRWASSIILEMSKRGRKRGWRMAATGTPTDDEFIREIVH